MSSTQQPIRKPRETRNRKPMQQSDFLEDGMWNSCLVLGNSTDAGSASFVSDSTDPLPVLSHVDSVFPDFSLNMQPQITARISPTPRDRPSSAFQSGALTGRLSSFSQRSSSTSNSTAGANSLRQSRELNMLKTKIKHLWDELDAHQREKEDLKRSMHNAPTHEMRMILLRNEVDKLTERRRAIFAVLKHIHNREMAIKEVNFLVQRHEAKRIKNYRQAENKLVKLNQIIIMEGQKVTNYIAEWRDLLRMVHRKPFVWEKRDYEIKMKEDLERFHQSSLYRYLLRGEEDESDDDESDDDEEGELFLSSNNRTMLSLKNQHELNLRASQQMGSQLQEGEHIQDSYPAAKSPKDKKKAEQKSPNNISAPKRKKQNVKSPKPRPTSKTKLRRTSKSPSISKQSPKNDGPTNKLTKEKLQEELFLQRSNMLQEFRSFIHREPHTEELVQNEGKEPDKCEFNVGETDFSRDFLRLPEPSDTLDEKIGDSQDKTSHSSPTAPFRVPSSPNTPQQQLSTLLSLLDEDDAAVRIQKCWRRYREKTARLLTEAGLDMDKKLHAILQIQSLWRGFHTRKYIPAIREEAPKQKVLRENSARVIYQSLKGHSRMLAWEKQKLSFETEQEAAENLLRFIRMMAVLKNMFISAEAIRMVQRSARAELMQYESRILVQKILMIQCVSRRLRAEDTLREFRSVLRARDSLLSLTAQRGHMNCLHQVQQAQLQLVSNAQQKAFEMDLDCIRWTQARLIVSMDRARIMHAHNTIIALQSCARSMHSQQEYIALQKQPRLVSLIQSGIRSYLCQSTFDNLHQEAIMEMAVDLLGEVDEETWMDIKEDNHFHELSKSGITIHSPEGSTI